MKYRIRLGLILLGIAVVALGLPTMPGRARVAAQSDTPENTCTTQFSDVPPDAYFYDPVLWLACRGNVSGYADGSYNPYGPTTRAQLTKIVVGVYGWPLLTPSTAHFSDVAPGSTFYPYIETAYARGIISGYSDGTFQPSSAVSRGAISKIVTLAAGWTVQNPAGGRFGDVLPGTTFYSAVETAAAHGILSGYSDGTFQPYNPATRGQVAKIIYRAFNLGCPLFPADNIWNRDITTLPVHANSKTYVASMGLSGNLHPDFGAGLYQGLPLGIPWTTVAVSQPSVPMTFRYAGESDPGPYPIPTAAPIEGGSDHHVLVMDQGGDCTLYEVYAAIPQPDGSWLAGSGARWNLGSNALRPNSWTSADAAGLPMLAGLVRYEEVQSGAIRHALRVTAGATANTHLWPARHDAGANDPSLPPMGLRLRLKADIDISTYPAADKVILTALKHYGMFVADTGSSWFITGVPDERWDNDLLGNLRGIHGSDFEAVDESGLMIDPDSGQSR